MGAQPGRRAGAPPRAVRRRAAMRPAPPPAPPPAAALPRGQRPRRARRRLRSPPLRRRRCAGLPLARMLARSRARQQHLRALAAPAIHVFRASGRCSTLPGSIALRRWQTALVGCQASRAVVPYPTPTCQALLVKARRRRTGGAAAGGVAARRGGRGGRERAGLLGRAQLQVAQQPRALVGRQVRRGRQCPLQRSLRLPALARQHLRPCTHACTQEVATLPTRMRHQRMNYNRVSANFGRASVLACRLASGGITQHP